MTRGAGKSKAETLPELVTRPFYRPVSRPLSFTSAGNPLFFCLGFTVEITHVMPVICLKGHHGNKSNHDGAAFGQHGAMEMGIEAVF